MNIGIDIDDTLTDTSPVIREYLAKYDSYYCNDQHLINSINDIMKGRLVDEDVKRFYLDRSKEMARTFQIKPNAKEIIDKLIEEGYKIIFITARSDNYYQNSQEFNTEYLNSKNINFHKLLTSQQDKAQACLNEKIDLMIDDSIDTCESVKASGVRTLVFTSDLNKDKETACERVSSWLELYDYIHKNLPIKKD